MDARRRLGLGLGITFATAGTAVFLGSPSPAVACGGFFCSQIRVDQTGEQIVFAMDRGQVRATILISYTGEAKDFAWVIPVTSKPTVTLAPVALFNQLRGRTNPSYYPEFTADSCPYYGWALAEDTASAPPSGGGAEGGVTVLDEQEVGPFEIKTLESNSAQALYDWLVANGYDQPQAAKEPIAHYVAKQMLFVAMKLKKDAEVGDIQPVTLAFQESSPCVPLVLTQIAAADDMPVLAYVLAPHRAFPTNWLHVQVNEKLINWLDWGSNYAALLTEAVDEASGHAFATEYAGSSGLMAGVLYEDGKYDLTKIAAITAPVAMMEEIMAQGYPADSLLLNVLKKYIPMPASLAAQGVTEQQFYNNMQSYEADLAGQTVDGVAMAAALEEKIVTPLKQAQDDLDKLPYLTRLYSTVSPDEMTRDPLFDVNAALPDVSNLHTATVKVVCDEQNQPLKAVVTLKSGEVFEIEGSFDNYPPPLYASDSESAAGTVEVLAISGVPIALTAGEQAAAVDAMFDSMPPEQVIAELQTGRVPTGTDPATGGPAATTPGTTTTPTGGGCASGTGQSRAPWGMLLALWGLGALARRRLCRRASEKLAGSAWTC